MSYYTEHLRFRPVLEKAQALDIGKNPAPEALFDPLIAGFNIWCIPTDQPDGWGAVEMDVHAQHGGAFSKPCAFVATVTWRWNEDETDPSIVGLNLTTMAYALRDLTREREDWWRKQDETLYTNRPEDVAWAKEKTRWLFEAAGIPMLPIYVENS